jgi:hypothetical protein
LIEQRDYRLDEPAFRQLLESKAQQDRPETEQVRQQRPL